MVWVGTGENNSQRSVGYGDGVYKSLDGGTTWENVGLEELRAHRQDPRRPARLRRRLRRRPGAAVGARAATAASTRRPTAARPGRPSSTISENTGVSATSSCDPRDPDVLLRRRLPAPAPRLDADRRRARSRRSTSRPTPARPGRKLEHGPARGRPGPHRPRASRRPTRTSVYAIVEAAERTRAASSAPRDARRELGEAQRLRDRQPAVLPGDRRRPARRRPRLLAGHLPAGHRGRRQDLPHAPARRFKHVDNHALWIDPADTDHLLVGCDGGLYESCDRGATWHFKANLPGDPVLPRRRRTTTLPFYNVYGGTQDNNTLGGPSRTTTVHGIANADWFVTVGGDGFEPQVDPDDPNIVYSQSQYGGLVRFDRRSGETHRHPAAAGPGRGAAALELGLAADHQPPLPHAALLRRPAALPQRRPRRHLARGQPRPDAAARPQHACEVMGTVWSVDAVAKNASTSFYGNIVVARRVAAGRRGCSTPAPTTG